MKPNALLKEQEELLDREGAELREMMKSDGWKVMSKLFKMTVEGYDSTRGLKTLKEMLARQDALVMMNAWMEAVIQRVSRLEHKETVRREVSERASRNGMIVVEDEAS